MYHKQRMILQKRTISVRRILINHAWVYNLNPNIHICNVLCDFETCWPYKINTIICLLNIVTPMI